MPRVPRLPLKQQLSVIAREDRVDGQIAAFRSDVSDSFYLTILVGAREVDVIVTPDRSSIRNERQKASQLIFDNAEIAVPSPSNPEESTGYRGHGFLSESVTVPGQPAGKLTITEAIH